MNRFIPKIMCLMLLFALNTQLVTAQKNVLKNNQQQPMRCATDYMMAKHFAEHPEDKIRYEQYTAQMDQKLTQMKQNGLLSPNVINTIPVVTHIILSNPALVTDATVQNQIDTLNWFYGNQSATDSLRTYEPFRTSYGRSNIRFCKAVRDPNGFTSTGIIRVTNSTVFSGSSAHPTTISPAWNTNLYLNMWVIDFGSSGLLGYSYTPGTFAPGNPQAGYVCDYRAFGSNAAYLYPAYNRGKTAVHEIGHFFNLAHTWGPNNSGNPGCTLTDGCADTPPCVGPTFGNPTVFPKLDACSPNAPGVMVQNHMDYADDIAMVLFTKEQCTRMDVALTTAPDRSTLLTSNGCVPVVLTNNDLGVSAIVSPTNASSTSCSPVNVVVTVRNNGANNVTSGNIVLEINGVIVAGPNALTINLIPGATANYTFSNVSLGSAGVKTIKAYTQNPNGVADTSPANDASTISITYSAATVLPRVADFVSTTFPPTGFTNVTVSGTSTQASWIRNNGGNGGANGSIGINFYSMSSGNTRDFRTTAASFAPIPNVADSIIATFDVNYRTYSTEPDRLQLLYSLDCGATWLPTGYDKAGSVLATLPPSTSSYSAPLTTNWRSERVALKNASIAAGGVIQFAFRGTSDFGNWCYIDNINIRIPVNRDISVTQINVPGTEECLPTFTPSIVVKNNGLQTVTSYQVGYTVDGGGAVTTPLITTPLSPGATVTLTLPTVTTTLGNHNFRAFTLTPTTAGGTGDQVLSNDTLAKAFLVKTIVGTPLSEGFIATTFAPAGWSIFNPNSNVTWVRNAAGNGTAGSAFFDNYSNNVPGQFDDLITVPFSTVNADSVIVSFDVAHKNYPGFSDELAILASNNCGAAYTATSYVKSGAALATAGSSTANYTAPAASDWRRERFSIGGTALNSGYAQLAFRNTNAYGNNIFLDNINISLLYRRDIQATRVAKPNDAECSGSFTPSINVSNKGLDTIKSFTATYIVDGGTPVVTNVTGINLVPLTGNASYPLTAISGLSIGSHSIKMYTSNLVTHVGTGDQFILNDTTSKIFTILGTQAAPLSENFEGTFPPTNWGRNNPDNSATGLWSQAGVGFNSPKSATMQNYTYGAASTASQVDELLTPNITYTNVDSVYLSFDLAAITKQYPGATQVKLDSFQVMVSKDCGNTFTSVFNKWGEDLQTINDPNYPNASAFVPNDNSVWKKVMLNITGAAGTSSTGLVVFFKNKSNNDNNIYLDNINVSTVTFPAKLKQQGYLLYPTPFSGNFNIQHYLAPTDLRYVEVYNAAGKLVYRRQYMPGAAAPSINVNLSNQAAGVYSVKLGYTNKQIVEKIIKTN
jgi:Pregnancy-associated plasma protein-A/Secretion system C-terminal sorting domain